MVKNTPRSGVKNPPGPSSIGPSTDDADLKLEVVVKADMVGTMEAVTAGLEAIHVAEVDVKVIQSGVGPVAKSDLLMAQTGNRLVVGFNVDLAPKLIEQMGDFGVEIRLYDTIYRLTEDVESIARSLKATGPEENITGRGKVIATFKGGPKGVIIGCEVTEGRVEVGKHFRVITAMGPAYTGVVDSLQVERTPVKSARVGQQVGIGISGWNRAKIGDLVECFETLSKNAAGRWQPRARVLRQTSS
jgi:translation initiation factor IF-2